MKHSQDRSEVFRALCLCNYTCSRVLNSLKLVKVNIRHAVEHGVTVVQLPVDHGADDGGCSVLNNVVPDVP